MKRTYGNLFFAMFLFMGLFFVIYTGHQDAGGMESFPRVLQAGGKQTYMEPAGRKGGDQPELLAGRTDRREEGRRRGRIHSCIKRLLSGWGTIPAPAWPAVSRYGAILLALAGIWGGGYTLWKIRILQRTDGKKRYIVRIQTAYSK